jgi:hypothetical protein
MKNRLLALATVLGVSATMLVGVLGASPASAAYAMCTSSSYGGNYYCGYGEAGKRVSPGLISATYVKKNGTLGYHVFVVAPNGNLNQVYTRWQDNGGNLSSWYNLGGNVKLPPTGSYLQAEEFYFGSYTNLQLKVTGTDGRSYCKIRRQQADAWDASWQTSYCYN